MELDGGKEKEWSITTDMASRGGQRFGDWDGDWDSREL